MSPIKPHLDSQSVYLVSSHTTSSSDLVTDYHVFFVTGNPGCIGYYHAFLPLLISGFEDRGLLDVKLHVYGCSAANFVDDNEKYKKGKILGLKGQIEYMEAKWQDYVNLQSLESRDRNGIDQRTRLKVVLMGHSVGAYMCMEILRRWKGREKEVSKQAAAGRPQSTIGEGVKDLEGLQGVEIVGLIGLWPTITEIARSPSGRRLGWMLRIPQFPLAIGVFVKVLTRVIPHSTLEKLVALVTRFPKSAVKTTTDFLTSSQGVIQALSMAADEMRDITKDRWTDEIWGMAALFEEKHTKLLFYFGAADHWVADEVRDNLISARGYKEGDEAWKPKMWVDGNSIPHSFCIHHSSTAAMKTVGFLADIIQADQRSLR